MTIPKTPTIREDIEDLNKELLKVRSSIRESNGDLQRLISQEKDIKRRIQQLTFSESPMIQATNAWCRITNALIIKYKPLAETNPEEAIKQLIRIEGALLAGGFLTDEELAKAL